jgi:hypothetical protein
VGDPIDVRVVELAQGGRQIRLARPGVSTEPKTEPAPRRRPRAPAAAREAPPEPQASFGTSLADKLRAALERSARRSEPD